MKGENLKTGGNASRARFRYSVAFLLQCYDPLQEYSGIIERNAGLCRRPNMQLPSIIRRVKKLFNTEERIELHHVANPYTRVSKANMSTSEKTVRDFRSLVNKISAENYEKIIQRLVTLKITDDKDVLAQITDIFFDKAVEESKFSKIYANMALEIRKAFGTSLTSCFITKCQKCFESLINTLRSEKTNGFSCDKSKLSVEEKLQLEESEKRAKRRFIGNLKFVGELYNVDFIRVEIIQLCTCQLLNSNGDDEVYYAAILLTVAGKKLDEAERTKPVVENALAIMKTDLGKRCPKTRFAVMDLLDLREAAWIPRSKLQAGVSKSDNSNEALVHNSGYSESTEEKHLTKKSTDTELSCKSDSVTGNKTEVKHVTSRSKEASLEEFDHTAKSAEKACSKKIDCVVDRNKETCSTEMNHATIESKEEVDSISSKGKEAFSKKVDNSYLENIHRKPNPKAVNHIGNRSNKAVSIDTRSAANRSKEAFQGEVNYISKRNKERFPRDVTRTANRNKEGFPRRVAHRPNRSKGRFPKEVNHAQNRCGEGFRNEVSEVSRTADRNEQKASPTDLNGTANGSRQGPPIEMNYIQNRSEQTRDNGNLDDVIGNIIKAFERDGDCNEIAAQLQDVISVKNTWPKVTCSLFTCVIRDEIGSIISLADLLFNLLHSDHIEFDAFDQGLKQLFEHINSINNERISLFEKTGCVLGRIYANEIDLMHDLKATLRPIIGTEQCTFLLYNLASTIVEIKGKMDLYKIWKSRDLHVEDFSDNVDIFKESQVLSFLIDKVVSLPSLTNALIDALIDARISNHDVINLIERNASGAFREKIDFFGCLTYSLFKACLLLQENCAFNRDFFTFRCITIKVFVRSNSFRFAAIKELMDCIHFYNCADISPPIS